MALVTYRDGSTKEVRNLGWLLRNTDILDHVVVEEGPIRKHGAHLRVFISHTQQTYAKPPLRFDTVFASREVLHRFLDRPSLQGLTVYWFGEPHIIGTPEYRDIDPNPIR